MAKSQSRIVQARGIVLTMGVALATFVPVWFLVAAVGTKYGLWPWTTGLLKMTGGVGVPLIGVLIVLTFVTSFLVVFVNPKTGFGSLGYMWVVTLAAAGIAFTVISGARAVPPIHDIATNTTNPLIFSERVIAARGPDANPIVPPQEAVVPFDKKRPSKWAGRPRDQIQAEAYPAIKSLKLTTTPPADVYQEALAAMRAKKWKIITEDTTEFRLEASVESFWYGFKDDVVLVVRPDGAGSVVDMRSVSRVGVSDLGANAKRIDTFLTALTD